jgi:hypothetical protein
MPRAARQQPPLPFSVPDPPGALALHRSPAQLRLLALQKEHERLLREIGKKKAACEVTEQAARDAASTLESRVRPMREAFQAAIHQLRTIFATLLGDASRLNRRDKARVRRLYMDLLPDLAFETEPRTGAQAASEDDFTGQDGAPFGANERVVDDGSESGYSASKPSEKNASLLRALFRRIAVALHPDKVQDPEQRETLTTVMKEVTRAYEMGDVARLVEIERTWLAAAPLTEQQDDLELRLAQLLQANKELRRQLRTLSAELKDLKQSVPGLDARRGRGGRVQDTAGAQVERFVQDMEREVGQLQGLRDFAQSFLDDEISLAEFLLGPPTAANGDEVDPFDQLLEDVLEAMANGRRSGQGKRKRRGG